MSLAVLCLESVYETYDLLMTECNEMYELRLHLANLADGWW